MEAETRGGLISGSYVLGGDPSITLVSDSREERRRRILEAADLRLQREEQAIEEMCGSAGSASRVATTSNHI